jgi:hypothetical protein
LTVAACGVRAAPDCPELPTSARATFSAELERNVSTARVNAGIIVNAHNDAVMAKAFMRGPVTMVLLDASDQVAMSRVRTFPAMTRCI